MTPWAAPWVSDRTCTVSIPAQRAQKCVPSPGGRHQGREWRRDSPRTEKRGTRKKSRHFSHVNRHGCKRTNALYCGVIIYTTISILKRNISQDGLSGNSIQIEKTSNRESCWCSLGLQGRDAAVTHGISRSDDKCSPQSRLKRAGFGSRIIRIQMIASMTILFCWRRYSLRYGQEVQVQEQNENCLIHRYQAIPFLEIIPDLNPSTLGILHS